MHHASLGSKYQAHYKVRFSYGQSLQNVGGAPIMWSASQPESTAKEPSGPFITPRIQRVLHFIEKNIERRICNGELAEIACLSRSYFLRRFAREIGQTPASFVRDRRLALAKRLLADTDLALCEVAYRCGFCSQSHMNAVFAERLKTTPLTYRVSRRNNSVDVSNPQLEAA